MCDINTYNFNKKKKNQIKRISLPTFAIKLLKICMETKG